VRLFRHDPTLYFVHRVHESVGPRIVSTGRRLGDAGFLIHHFGLAITGQERARKNEMYRRMGEAKIRENPQDAQAYFELGLEEFEHFDDPAAAIEHFAKAAQLKPKLRLAWLFQGLARLKLEQDARALECFRMARRGGHDSALLAESAGDAHYNLGNCAAAEREYRQALQMAAEPSTIESKLGLTHVRAGRSEEGLALLVRALERQPAWGHLYDRLVAATVSLNRLADAAAAAECKLVNVTPDPDSFLRAAALQARQGNHRRAGELLSIGMQRFPDAAKLRECLREVQSSAEC